MFHITAMMAMSMTWAVVRFGVFAGPAAARVIEGPFKRIVDGTVELAYKRGCLDGALVGAVVVLIIMSRRKQP